MSRCQSGDETLPEEWEIDVQSNSIACRRSTVVILSISNVASMFIVVIEIGHLSKMPFIPDPMIDEF